MGDAEQENALESLTKFAGYLLSRIEAIENLLIQDDPAAKEKLRAAVAAVEKHFGHQLKMLPDQDEAAREHAIADILKRLKGRAGERLR